MENFILVVHVLLALGIIGLIMLQQGKGAEMGASFGSGSSQTVFGAAGTGNFFSRMTGILAAVFFATSVTLAVVAKNTSVIDDTFVPTSSSPAEAVIDDDADISDLGAALEGATQNAADNAASALEQVESEAKAGVEKAEKSLENAAKALESE